MSGSEAFSGGVKFFHRLLRAQPRAIEIFSATAGGITASPWVENSPEVQAALAESAPRHAQKIAWKMARSAKRHMEMEREALELHGAAMLARLADDSAKLPRQMYTALLQLAKDSEHGGPNVLAVHRALAEVLEQMYGKAPSLTGITWAWKELVDRGVLTVTPGSFGQRKGTVYHLLPLNWEELYFTSPSCGGSRASEVTLPEGWDSLRVRGAFRRSFERLREEKTRELAVLATGNPGRWPGEDVGFDLGYLLEAA